MSILRKDAKPIRILEQLIEDRVSGLTIQFALDPFDNTSRLRIYGDIPHGNREIIFNAAGQEAGGGVALTGFLDSPNDDPEERRYSEEGDRED